MDATIIKAGAEDAAKGVDFIASKNDRWLLIALVTLVIVALAFLLDSETNRANQGEAQLLNYLREEKTHSDLVIEKNTEAFNNVNTTLLLLAAKSMPSSALQPR